MKKIVSIAAVAVLSLSLLTACNKTGADCVDDALTMSVVGGKSGGSSGGGGRSRSRSGSSHGKVGKSKPKTGSGVGKPKKSKHYDSDCD